MHVLGDADSFSVNFYDGSSNEATLVGYDRLTDIAVIKCDRKDLKSITFASHEPVIGSRAIAIGNPYGYTWSMSAGVVSGLSRSLFTQDGMMIPNLIQTDNFINPVLNMVTGGQMYTLQDVAGFASAFISSLVNFFIMAFVLFCLLKGVNKLVSLGVKEKPAAAPTTKKCPYCFTEIDIHATRCPNCTSELPKEEEAAKAPAEA